MHPFIKPHSNEQIWVDYFDKYQLMCKEYLLTCLRNPSRQHRGGKRFCKDMAILIAEGNFTDETILTEKNIQVKKSNTVGLLSSIRLSLASMRR